MQRIRVLRQALQYLPVSPFCVSEASGLMVPQRECEGLVYARVLHRAIINE
jgi:hypothetical protein